MSTKPVNTGVPAAAVNTSNQSKCSDACRGTEELVRVTPVDLEDPSILYEFSNIQRGSMMFLIFGVILLIVGAIFASTAEEDSDKGGPNTLIAFGVIFALIGGVYWWFIRKTEDIVITETRFNRRYHEKIFNFMVSYETRQYSLDKLSGVELKTKAKIWPLFLSILFWILGVVFVIVANGETDKSVKKSNQDTATYMIVIAVLLDVWYLISLYLRKATLRMSFEHGLSAADDDSAFSVFPLVSALMNMNKYEEEIVVQLAKGAELFRCLSAMRLKALYRVDNLRINTENAAVPLRQVHLPH